MTLSDQEKSLPTIKVSVGMPAVKPPKSSEVSALRYQTDPEFHALVDRTAAEILTLTTRHFRRNDVFARELTDALVRALADHVR